ncbi:cobalamin-binding protein [Sphingomonas sp. URHD0057]|uniref:cobalamin-binding protein n=1 Tax=Sphingomonas sp. URHD0057 TaxID=1380389 RepID=UPI000567DCA3|nr:cobalamin-binding protein [Sphingomonas sp. URHD0057]
MADVKNLRIVSLLPSATEIVVALGLGEQLVGRSHECDYPEWVQRLPVCTSTKLEKGLTSRQIDDRVHEIVRQGLSVYEVDAELLRSLRPDVILTQSQCAVCAVTPADLEEALGSWLGTAPRLLSLSPDTLDDVWGDIASVACASGVGDRGRELVRRLQARLEMLPKGDERSRVLAIEWVDPLMIAGNWIPELIELAGGMPLLAGQHSHYVDWADAAAQDPGVIIVMPCGYRVEQSLAEMGALTRLAGWASLTAVRDGRVFIADGQYFFNRPGPRLVESAEMVTDMLRAPADVQRSEDGSWVRFTPYLAASC